MNLIDRSHTAHKQCPTGKTLRNGHNIFRSISTVLLMQCPIFLLELVTWEVYALFLSCFWAKLGFSYLRDFIPLKRYGTDTYIYYINEQFLGCSPYTEIFWRFLLLRICNLWPKSWFIIFFSVICIRILRKIDLSLNHWIYIEKVKDFSHSY